MNLRTYLMIKAAATEVPVQQSEQQPIQLPSYGPAARNKYLVMGRATSSPNADRLEQLANESIHARRGRVGGHAAPAAVPRQYAQPYRGYAPNGAPATLPQAAPAVPRPAVKRPDATITPQQQQAVESQLMQGYYGTHGGIGGIF